MPLLGRRQQRHIVPILSPQRCAVYASPSLSLPRVGNFVHGSAATESVFADYDCQCDRIVAPARMCLPLTLVGRLNRADGAFTGEKRKGRGIVVFRRVVSRMGERGREFNEGEREDFE